MAYGDARDQAIGAVERLAVEVIADRIMQSELPDQIQHLSNGTS